jgi:hypothetical protein
MSMDLSGDPEVDELLVTAEAYSHYGLLEPIRGQLDALAALPDSPARTAGRERLEALLAGAESRYVPAPPTPYIEEPPKKAHDAVIGEVIRVGEYRRAPAEARQFLGFTADEVRGLLGPPDSERVGRHWFSKETGKHLARVGEELVEEIVFGPVPNLEPGRPYFIWTYDMMLNPKDPDPSPESEWSLSSLDEGSTWLLYFFAIERQPTVVFEAGSVPRNVEF